jgi:CRP-like cAMP-binding protein
MAWVNHFLETLAPADLKRLEPSLTRTRLEQGRRLADREDLIGVVYFPIDSILSVITTMLNGASIESRAIGRESGYGLLHAIGSRYAYERVEVQVGGEAWQIPTAALSAAAAASESLRASMVQHAQATLAQAAQSVACIALHDATQRMCRWLLMTRDRLGSDVVPLTQEHLAIMLGVQRTTVTAIASELQARGLIQYSRGRITILDGGWLRRRSCECYDEVEHAVARILPG